MPSSWLNVPHFQQEHEYSCIAACARMVLARKRLVDLVTLLGWDVRHGRQKSVEVSTASGIRFTAQIVHRQHHRQLLAGGAGEELANGVAFPRGEGFDVLLQRLRQFDGQRAHGFFRIRFRNSRGVIGATPNCSEP